MERKSYRRWARKEKDTRMFTLIWQGASTADSGGLRWQTINKQDHLMLTRKRTNNKEWDFKVMVGKKQGMGDITFSLGWLGASRLHDVTVPGGPDKHSDWTWVLIGSIASLGLLTLCLTGILITYSHQKPTGLCGWGGGSLWRVAEFSSSLCSCPIEPWLAAAWCRLRQTSLSIRL